MKMKDTERKYQLSNLKRIIRNATGNLSTDEMLKLINLSALSEIEIRKSKVDTKNSTIDFDITDMVKKYNRFLI